MQPTKIILTPEQDQLLGGLFTLQPWLAPWRSRRLIRSLTVRRLQERFRGSVLGAVWVFLQPILMLAVYALAFVGMLNIGGASTFETKVELTFSLFCGLILYTVFNETTLRSATAISSQPQFVKKVVFPLDALPVVAIAESLVLAFASVLVLLLGTALLLGRVHVTWLLLPVPLFVLCLLALGAGWLFAAVGVFVRDLTQILAVVLQMLFFLTPIVYRVQDLPPWAQQWIALNPLSPIIEATRAVVLRGELPDFARLGAVAVLAAVLLHFGYAVFSALQRRFADVL